MCWSIPLLRYADPQFLVATVITAVQYLTSSMSGSISNGGNIGAVAGHRVDAISWMSLMSLEMTTRSPLA